MADKLYATSLVKNPIFWLSIVAIVVVVLCLFYAVMSKMKKRQHTSSSTIDVKYVEGKDTKHKFDGKKFLKEVMGKVDEKIKKEKKERENNDKKNEEKMKKLEEEMEKIKEGNQKLLDDMKEQVKPLIDEVIEKQFGEGEGEEGSRLQAIKNIIYQITSKALEDAKQYANDALQRWRLQPEQLEEALTILLNEHQAWLHYIKGNSLVPVEESPLYTALTNAIKESIKMSARPIQILNKDNNEKYIVSRDDAEKIACLMAHKDDDRSEFSNIRVRLKNVKGNGDSYEVTQGNVETVFPVLSLFPLGNDLLFKP